jgi:sugar phosphate isomerase/epimerase
MQFSSYVTPMDRDYGKPSVDDTSTNDVGIGVQDIGQAVPLGIAAANVQGVGAKMRAGAGALEIQFAGAVRGQRQAQTPGMYGWDQRQALKELAEVAEVKLTTHASLGIMGLAGMDQQGNFSKEQRKLAVDEIKRAVEFAADTAEGGSVVVHTGEFQRPISEETWALKDPSDPNKGFQFMHHGEEPERAIIRVVDDRTGQVMTQVRKNQKVARAVWSRTKEEGWLIATKDNDILGYKAGDRVHVKKNQYVDYEGNPLDISQRVPEYDTDTGRFKVEYYTWDNFVKEAEERNNLEAEKRGITIQELKLRYPNEYVLPEEAFLKATLETNEGHSRGWAGYYARDFEDAKKDLIKLRKSLTFYEKLEKTIPEDQLWQLKKEAAGAARRVGVPGLVPSEYKLPSDILKDAIIGAERTMEFEHQASVSQQQQAEDSRETQQHVMSARKYALRESYNSYAEAGVHAMDLTRQKHLEKKPLIITMENIFPESYGAHPDELRSLIENSRKQMVTVLTSPTVEGRPNPSFRAGISKAEAEKAAEVHIKATLDTGHFNLWRKYWQNDPSKSMTQNDTDYKRWMLKKTEELAKANLVGNVHLTDNFGYQDDHLSPGEGTTPVKEIVKILKKHGYKGALSIEPGADATTDLSDFHGLMKTWRLFGSPVYGAHGPVGKQAGWTKGSWTNIQYSYFGQNKAPYYVFGPYAPSQDWTLWSQVPME